MGDSIGRIATPLTPCNHTPNSAPRRQAPVAFKTGALNRSATHPLRASRSWRGVISYRRYPQRKRAKLSLVVASAASAWHQFAYFPTKGIHLDRKSVVSGKSVSVSVDLGGVRIIKKKKKE